MCDNYARVLCKIVVAQIAKNLGFASISQIACDSLADVIQLYIEDIGIRAHEYSELSCRTDSNFFDVKQTFEDMAINIHELQQFLLQSDEIPFMQVIPPFPLQTNNNENKPLPTKQTEEKDFPLHIPSFLPSFPETHTFLKTPLYGEVVTDSYKVKKTKSKQKRQVENSLIKLTDITTTKVPNYDNIKQQMYSRKESPNTNNTTNKQQQNKNDEMNLDNNNENDNNNNNNRNNNNNNSNNNNNNNINNNKDIIPPTPLEQVSNTFYHKLEEEDLKKHEEAPRRSLLSEEDQERAKKRVKCERILSLAHESAHSTINEDDKEKDIITEHD